MSDLIDRKVLLDCLDRCLAESDGNTPITDAVIVAIKCAVEQMPAVDAEPVRHGHWKGFTHDRYCGTDEYGEPIWREGVIYYCSQCNRRTIIKENYCPNCGAKMDEKEENDE